MAILIDSSAVATIDLSIEYAYGASSMHHAINETIDAIQAFMDSIDSMNERDATWREIRDYIRRNGNAAHRVYTLERNVSHYAQHVPQYRCITRNVLTAPCMAGDRTHNGDMRHKRQADSAQKHVQHVAYVLSDTRIYNDVTGESTTVTKRGGIPLLRDTDGSVNADATLRLASLVGVKRAANRKVN